MGSEYKSSGNTRFHSFLLCIVFFFVENKVELQMFKMNLFKLINHVSFDGNYKSEAVSHEKISFLYCYFVSITYMFENIVQSFNKLIHSRIKGKIFNMFELHVVHIVDYAVGQECIQKYAYALVFIRAVVNIMPSLQRLFGCINSRIRPARMIMLSKASYRREAKDTRGVSNSKAENKLTTLWLHKIKTNNIKRNETKD